MPSSTPSNPPPPNQENNNPSTGTYSTDDDASYSSDYTSSTGDYTDDDDYTDEEEGYDDSRGNTTNTTLRTPSKNNATKSPLKQQQDDSYHSSDDYSSSTDSQEYQDDAAYDPIESLDLNSPFIRNLRKMFDEIDQSGDGYIQGSELAQILRAFGKSNVSEADIRQMIGTVDIDGDNQLDFQEFVLMVRDAMPEMFDRAQNPRAWRKYILRQMKDAFKVFDKDGDGVISREEMRFVLRKLSSNKEISDTDLNSIIHLLDENHDGEIDFDEFTRALNDEDSILYQQLEAVLMPSPLDYLQSFMYMPDSFRPSLLHRKMREGTQLASRFMKPYLNESGLAYQDLILDLSNPKEPKLLPCYLENCGTFKIRLVSANGIPSPNIHAKQFQTNQRIVQYKAYLCLIDLTTNEFLSNVYTVKAKRNKNREDGWKFSRKNPLNDVYVRSFHDLANLALYIELVLVISTKGDSGYTMTEQCVGWSTLPISKDLYKNVQAQRLAPIPLQAKGGTLEEPIIINQSDIRNRRKDFAGILRNVLYVGKPNPTINVKVSRVGKAKQIEHFSKCPPNLIFNEQSVPVLQLYRTILAQRLIDHPNLDEQHRQVNSIMLSQMPKLMDDPDIWMNFVSSWKSIKASSKKREQLFIEHMRNYFPVRYCLSVPSLQPESDAANDKKATTKKERRKSRRAQQQHDSNMHKQRKEQRNHFINQFAVASKKMTCQSDYTYEPFDMQSETLYDIL